MNDFQQLQDKRGPMRSSQWEGLERPFLDSSHIWRRGDMSKGSIYPVQEISQLGINWPPCIWTEPLRSVPRFRPASFGSGPCLFWSRNWGAEALNVASRAVHHTSWLVCPHLHSFRPTARSSPTPVMVPPKPRGPQHHPCQLPSGKSLGVFGLRP